MSKSNTVNEYGSTPFVNDRCQSLTTVNKNGFTPFANGGCQSLTTINKNGFTPSANGECQSLLQSTRMGSHPLLMVDVKVYYSQQEYIATFVESICIHKFN